MRSRVASRLVYMLDCSTWNSSNQTMHTRSTRKKNPTRASETVERPQQTHFTPRNRTVLLRNRSSSTPKTRQQTLTQIDFVSRLPLDNEDDELAYEEEELPWARKRRKTMPEKTVNPRKGTTAKQPAKRKDVNKARNDLSQGNLIAEDELGQSSQHPESNMRGHNTTLPPTTPRKIVKTEIPSSQSPASTALSTQSRRSLRMYSRSPLKERSTNNRTCPNLHLREIKSIGGMPKLEVRDTYEKENEEFQLPGLVSRIDSSEIQRLTRSGMGQCRSLEDTTFIDNYKDNVRPNLPQEKGAGRVLRAASGNANRVRNTTRESFSEEEAVNNLAEEDFNAGLDTQAALQHVESLASESSRDGRLHSDPVDVDRTITFPSKIRNAVPIGGDRSPHQNIKDEGSCQNRPFSPPDTNPTGYRTRSSTPSPAISPPRRTDSEQASDQLAADLNRLAQNTFRTLLDTDSQIENAFRPYSPQPQLDEDINNHTTTDHLSHHNSYSPSPPTVPEASRTKQQPISPSQATTVDITQPSQQPKRLTQLRPSPQGPPPPLSNNGLVLGPPVPPSVFSSSPLDGGELSSQYTPLWDGRPLTDSQLLPDSLMNINIPPPPGWRLTQESLEEE